MRKKGKVIGGIASLFRVADGLWTIALLFFQVFAVVKMFLDSPEATGYWLELGLLTAALPVSLALTAYLNRLAARLGREEEGRLSFDARMNAQIETFAAELREELSRVATGGASVLKDPKNN